jgi:rhamnogalacturonyl hydrolase YesR
MDRTERILKVKNAMLAMQRYSWEQGVTSQALLENGETDMVVLMAHDAVVRQSEDGRLAQMGSSWGITDPASNGEAVIYACKITGDEKYKRAADRMIDFLMNKADKTDDGTLCHFDGGRQIWVDSFYMAPPFLAAAGEYKEAENRWRASVQDDVGQNLYFQKVRMTLAT